MSRIKISLMTVAAGVLAFALFSVLNEHTPAPQVTFVSLKGDRIATADLRGRVALVNFWATDCPGCMREMPDMIRTYDKYRGRGLELIAVAMKYDPPNYVIDYTQKNALPFTVALDPLGELAKLFGDVKLTPTTFVIDRHGNIVSRIVGEPDFAKLHQLLEQKLADPA
jgi:peroxiredoxin